MRSRHITLAGSPRPRFAVSLVLALIGLLLGAGLTHASPTLVTNSYELGSNPGPNLALDGPATLVATSSGEHGPYLVRSFTPGSSTVLAHVAFGHQRGSLLFSASPTRIAVLGTEAHTEGSEEKWIQVLESGPLGGALQPLPGECPFPWGPGLYASNKFPPHSTLAVDGEVVAYDTSTCVYVHDFSSGLTRLIPLEAPFGFIEGPLIDSGYVHIPLQVAGRFVAFRSGPESENGSEAVVVYDVDSGSDVDRVRLPESQRAAVPWNGPTFALQSDGTVVVADPWSCTAIVSTVASPSPRPLGIPACAVNRLVAGRALVVTPGRGRDRVLAWTSLEAPAPHLVADLGPEGILEASPSTMDEDSVVYALTSCTDEPDIYRAPLAEPGVPPARPAKCPVRVAGGHATVGARKLRVKLTCPSGCEGELTAYIGTSGQLRRGRGIFIYGEGPPLLAAPGKSVTVTLVGPEAGRVGRRLIARLRRDRRLRLELQLRLSSPTRQHQYGIEGSESRIVAPIRATTGRAALRARRSG